MFHYYNNCFDLVIFYQKIIIESDSRLLSDVWTS